VSTVELKIDRDRYLKRMGGALRRLRKRAKLTQAQVAEAVGISASAWCKVEKGLVNPGLFQLAKFGKRTGFSLSQIDFESSFKPPPPIRRKKTRTIRRKCVCRHRRQGQLADINDGAMCMACLALTGLLGVAVMKMFLEDPPPPAVDLLDLP